MVAKYGALKIAKLLKIYIIISLDRLLTSEKKYPYIYVTFRIWTTSNTNKYKAKNDRFLVIKCQWKRIQVIKITVLNNA